MNEIDYITEITEKFEKYELKIPTEVSKTPKVICDESEHNSLINIREGNRLFLILVKNNKEWEVKYTICSKCSVNKLFEKVSIEYDCSAVVEGVLKEVPSYADTDMEVYIEDPKVWELNK